ncbi:MAG: hypothetical protein HQL65_07100 [Magnetococcales bacterium]|nr:hypothetical protein [Magnetococcales bacterium]
MLAVTLPDTMEKQLHAMVEETGGTITELVVHAIERYLQEMEEDRQDIAAARLALEEYERDGGGVSLDEFVQELGFSARRTGTSED